MNLFADKKDQRRAITKSIRIQPLSSRHNGQPIRSIFRPPVQDHQIGEAELVGTIYAAAGRQATLVTQCIHTGSTVSQQNTGS